MNEHEQEIERLRTELIDLLGDISDDETIDLFSTRHGPNEWCRAIDSALMKFGKAELILDRFTTSLFDSKLSDDGESLAFAATRKLNRRLMACIGPMTKIRTAATLWAAQEEASK